MKHLRVTKKELEDLYTNYKSRDAAIKLGVCLATYYKMLDAAKIPRKRNIESRKENVTWEIME